MPNKKDSERSQVSKIDISVITPSIREEGLDMVRKCLTRQSTNINWEWLVCSPFEYEEAIHVPEPEKGPDDFYSLNRAWNALFREAKGDLVVNIVDWMWFTPDVLQKLWDQYQSNPKAVISGVGHQYDQIENGKPENLVWRDPRVRTDFGSFYEVPHTEMEFCLVSFPKQAVVDVGGIDETFDKYAALGEKELAARMYKAGYTLWLNQDLEYRAFKHPRLNGEDIWEQKYREGTNYYLEAMKQVENGVRLNINQLSDGH